MTKSGILETRSHLSQIINKVMRGNEHIIMRKNIAVAKIVPIEKDFNARQLIAQIEKIRSQVKKPTTVEEIIAWKNEGRK